MNWLITDYDREREVTRSQSVRFSSIFVTGLFGRYAPPFVRIKFGGLNPNY